MKRPIARRNPKQLPSGREIAFTCIRPELHRNGDADPSCRWNPEKQVFLCDVCGVQGGLADLARAFGIIGTEAEPNVIYDYRDAGGPLVFQVVRGPGKRFWQRRPLADGSWESNVRGVPRLLYRLPELLSTPLDAEVLILEGEKNVDRARTLGFTATCNPGGAGKWRGEYAEHFRGRTVVIVADNDNPGHAHARIVAQALVGTAASVRVISALPGVDSGGDLSDWLDAGGTADELRELIVSTPGYKPESEGLPSHPRVTLIRLADVQPEPVGWLWTPYIPRRKLTLLEGDPGVGKSWITAAVATGVTLGRGLPGEQRSEQGAVLMMSAEDGLADTIRPRLDRMGADVARIFSPEELLILDDEGFLVLEEYITQVTPALVILDPIVAYLGARVDTHRANELRAITAKLAKLAERLDTTIVAVRHLSKAASTRAIYRGIGSIDLTAAARSVLLAGADPDNPTNRAIVHVKSNLAAEGASVGYTITDGEFHWIGTSDLTAERLLAPESGEESRGALDEAVDFLKETLNDGPQSTNEVAEEAVAAGISERTLKRARRHLGMRAERVGERGQRGAGEWVLRLPESVKGANSANIGNSAPLTDSISENGRNPSDLGPLNPDELMT